MKKLKRITDISKGLIAIGLIIGATPFIVYPILWYWVQTWKVFF